MGFGQKPMSREAWRGTQGPLGLGWMVMATTGLPPPLLHLPNENSQMKEVGGKSWVTGPVGVCLCHACHLTSFAHVPIGCHTQWETQKFTFQFIKHLLNAEESDMNLWIWSLLSKRSESSRRQVFSRYIPEPQEVSNHITAFCR